MRENNLNVQMFSSCNCNCSFCDFTDKCASKVDSKLVLDYIDEHPNIQYILLTGGEPTFNMDAYVDIVKHIDTKEKMIVLQTNGWWGNNVKIKQILREYPPTLIQVSVDSQKQKWVNLDTIKNAISFLKECSIRYVIINHTNSYEEYSYYLDIFPEVREGKIVDINKVKANFGVAILANNQIGRLTEKG